MITNNAYQSMFMVYETGVVVVDAPPDYAAHILTGIREVTDKPITHLIYSHSHTDHIGGMKALGPVPTIIAHEETKRLLARDNDPNRPLPTVTFQDKYTLKVGSQVLELSYHGDGHEPGNIFIYAPAQQTLMVVDVIFPGWMPWRRFAVAHDVPGRLRAGRRDPQAAVQNAGRRSCRANGDARRRGAAERILSRPEGGRGKSTRQHEAGRRTGPGRARQCLGRVRRLHRSRRHCSASTT